MKRRTPEETRNRINRLSEALFGVPDEVGEEEAEQALREAGLDTEALQERMYQRLYAEAQQYWMAQKDLPPLLKKALDDLRPLSAPPRNEAELARQAKTSVERIVEKVQTPRVRARARGATDLRRILPEQTRHDRGRPEVNRRGAGTAEEEDRAA